LREYYLKPQELDILICSSVMTAYVLGQKGWRNSFGKDKTSLNCCIVNTDADNCFSSSAEVLHP